MSQTPGIRHQLPISHYVSKENTTVSNECHRFGEPFLSNLQQLYDKKIKSLATHNTQF